jgi:hypothetical protein
MTMMTTPAEFGEFQCTMLEGGAIRVNQADPRVRVSARLVRLAREGDPFAPGVQLADGRLVIKGENRTVIYRIGAYHADGDWYEAEWPD